MKDPSANVPGHLNLLRNLLSAKKKVKILIFMLERCYEPIGPAIAGLAHCLV